MKAPVALIFFNRPEKTERIFSAIARARPSRLLLIADGPRPGNDRDVAMCEASRRVVERVEWDCEVSRNYADVNLGCGRRPATGLDWVFEQEDRAIILEDDGLPDDTFFPFCDELLERYADDSRICQISSQNLQSGQQRGAYSYYFSRHNFCAGGWASWRRAWSYYDYEMKRWPELRDMGVLRDVLQDERAVKFWHGLFDRAWANPQQTGYWDYQWTFACWLQNGLSITPNANLLSNIGFGPDATHTHWEGGPSANLQLKPIAFPLNHPPFVAAHADADRFFADVVLPPEPPSLLRRIRWRLGALLPPTFRRMLKGLLYKKSG